MSSEGQSKHINHERRKQEHLEIGLNEPVQFKTLTTGFEDYYFVHQALPEIDLAKVNLSVKLFGKTLAAPILISAMVGGIGPAAEINRNLAKAAQDLGLALGVGSERYLIESPEVAATFQVRDVAPDILLLANLGAIQLNYGFGIEECRQAVKAIDADALVLHLNPLQEALQPAGNTNFAGLIEKISRVCAGLTVPVIVKEVGWGMSAEVAGKLVQAGVAGIDIAGAGGTCWSEIEGRRTDDDLAKRVAGAFAGWGIPTAESLLLTRKAAPRLPIIASGGIRSGLDVAKAIALGAEAAGIAWPLLKPAASSAGEVVDNLKEIIEVLRIAMFCIGAADIDKLKYSPFLQKR
jgi:isopentenyl-diphosphate delta-isomerase